MQLSLDYSFLFCEFATYNKDKYNWLILELACCYSTHINSTNLFNSMCIYVPLHLKRLVCSVALQNICGVLRMFINFVQIIVGSRFWETRHKGECILFHINKLPATAFIFLGWVHFQWALSHLLWNLSSGLDTEGQTKHQGLGTKANESVSKENHVHFLGNFCLSPCAHTYMSSLYIEKFFCKWQEYN